MDFARKNCENCTRGFMKKFLAILVLCLCLVCKISFADETQKSMNDYLNEGWILFGKEKLKSFLLPFFIYKSFIALSLKSISVVNSWSTLIVLLSTFMLVEIMCKCIKSSIT